MISVYKLFVLIEPNNSGFADDDLQKHIEKAERTDLQVIGETDAT